jgi:spore coat protein A, manganese oxidase
MSSKTNDQGKNKKQSRRTFLNLAGAGTAGAYLFSMNTPLTKQFSAFAQTNLMFTDQLPIPPKINAMGGGTFDLSMGPGMHRFHSSLAPTPTWGYGGAAYLGPTIEARRGVPIRINAHNRLGSHPLGFAIDTKLHGALSTDAMAPRASLHLHGGNTEPKSDGHPEATFRPGQTYRYHYDNDQEAANLWYHDHALGITRLNVYAGLAGYYLMRDNIDTGLERNPLNLPFGEYEVPLVLQDKMFNANGSLAYPPGLFGSVWAPEFFGDVAVVNGKIFPNLNVDRGLYRFRIINGSNSRVYNLRLSTGQPLYVIGGDGGLLNAPVPLEQLVIAPGERADILVDFSNFPSGTRVVLSNNAPTPFPNGPRSARRGGVPLRNIMQFTVGSNTGFRAAIPGRLRSSPIIPLTNWARVRNVSLVEIMDSATGAPAMALLNNLPWMTNQIEMPVVDTVELWNIINTTGDLHPIHLHLVQFQVVGRQPFDVGAYTAATYPNLMNTMGQGTYPAPAADQFARGAMKPPALHERGWKDTVQAYPGEITRIAVPFGGRAAPGVPFGKSFTGDYVWHCHILEHEDNEMMLPYRVVAR